MLAHQMDALGAEGEPEGIEASVVMVGKMARARAWYMGRIAGSMTLGAISCLPTEDLGNYGQAAPISATDDAPGNSRAPGATDPESVGSAVDAGGPGSDDGSSENGVGAGCMGDCPLPNPQLEPSTTNDQVATAAQSLDAGSDAANVSASEPVPPSSDAGTALPSCPPATLLGPGDRCFQLSTVARAWAAARTACQNLGVGWDLATIHDAERDAWLVALLGTVPDAWVGASDLDAEGVWRWVTDSNAFWNGGPTGASVGGAFANWNGGATAEPNGGEASDCLRVRLTTGWADFQCATAYASICEGPTL